MHGVPTDEAVVAAFRADYLYTGNAAKSARKVGIPEGTGRDIARRLADDSEFAAERRRLRANALDEAERAVMDVVRIGRKRYRDELPEPKAVGEGATVVITDRRPDYGKLIIDAHKTLAQRTRFDDERDGSVQPAGPVFILHEASPAEPQESPPPVAEPPPDAA